MADSLLADESSIFESIVAQPGQSCPDHVGLDRIFQGVEPDALPLKGSRPLFRATRIRKHVSSANWLIIAFATAALP